MIIVICVHASGAGSDCRIFYAKQTWAAVMRASVMESEFNEHCLFDKHENKEATIQFSGSERRPLVDVIRPFCSAHNTTVVAERRLQTSPSLASLCIRSS